MSLNNLNPEQKRAILQALVNGLLTKDEVLKPDFNPHLYSLIDLPVFAFRDKHGIKFMNERMDEQQYINLLEYYKMIGNTQQVILID